MKFETFFLGGASPIDHLACESCLQETWVGNNPMLCFYVNDPCLIIGRNQNPWREVSPASRLPVYRRTSGGGAVYHDRGNLNWAIIVSRALHDKDKELECIAAALRELGYPVEGGERGGLFFGQGACLSGLSGLSGRKVSGTARRFGTRTVLHHGTLLVSSDLEALANSLGGIATEADTSLPSVKADPANINQFSSPGTAFPLRDPMEAAFALSRILSDRNPEPCPGELLPKEFLEKEKSSLASREWIYDATPTFGFSLGNLENCFSFIVEKGRIRRVDGHKRNEFDPFEGSIFSIAIYLEMHAVAETLSRRKEDNR